MKKLYLFFLINISLQATPNAPYFPTTFPTFHEWKKACDLLAPYDYRDVNFFISPLKYEHMLAEINTFFALMTTNLTKATWIGHSPSPHFYGLLHDVMEPYVQKLVLPAGSTIAIHGDLHGDVHSLNRFIQYLAAQGRLDHNDPFHIQDRNFYIVFLGDYVDRGWYGAETLYTILRLKNANPDHVFMVRGNHEDNFLNMRYGFAEELDKKFKISLHDRVYRLYNFLPLALYIGSGPYNGYNFVQCCHGGIEIGFNPSLLLKHNTFNACMKIDRLMQADGFALIQHVGIDVFKKYFKNNVEVAVTNGFMWSDFIVDEQSLMALSNRDGQSGTIFEWGKLPTEELLHAWSGTGYTLRAIFRGHQHSSKPTAMMKRILNIDRLGHINDAGAGKMWIVRNKIHREEPYLLDDVAVVTFAAAPDTGYDIPYQAFGMLTLAQDYNDWRLQIMRLAPRIRPVALG